MLALIYAGLLIIGLSLTGIGLLLLYRHYYVLPGQNQLKMKRKKVGNSIYKGDDKKKLLFDSVMNNVTDVNKGKYLDPDVCKNYVSNVSVRRSARMDIDDKDEKRPFINDD